MNPRLTELLAYLRASRVTLGDAIASIPATRHTERPGEDRWSVAEVVEHLALIEKGIARSYARWFAEARATGLGPEADSSPLLEKMRMERVVDRSRRIAAPPFAVPSHGRGVAESLAIIDEARGRLAALAEEADGLDLGAVTRPHPAMGPLTLYEWLGFTAAHMERHAGQIREVGGELE